MYSSFNTRVWEGATVGIVGGGPSLRIEEVARLRDSGARIIGVNDAYQFGTLVDVCFWGDARWFYGNPENGHPGHKERVLKWPGIRVTCAPECVNEGQVLYMHRWSADGLQLPPRVRWYCNSGLSAINIAIALGANRVYLFGFDGQKIDDKNNWHADNVGQPTQTSYMMHRTQAERLMHDLKRWPWEVQIWNCSPNSAFCFPTTTIEEACHVAQEFNRY